MSVNKKNISLLIKCLIKIKAPMYIDKYLWRNSDDIDAMKWLSHKKFLRYKNIGRHFKIYRSKHFYEIFEKIKGLNENEIIKFLKMEVNKDGNNTKRKT